jgi:hypothetical protein
MKQEMHPSNQMFQSLIGKTVSAVEYVDDFDEGITLRFTDGSFLCVAEEMQAGRIQVAASINEAEPPEDVYYLDGDQLRVLNAISDALHSGSDAMRDLGHKLWLVLNQVEKNK